MVAPAVIMGMMAWGMWHARYWAVLGFQLILVIVLFSAFFGLLVGVSSVSQAIGTVALLAVAGTFFFFMVKAMARIQMPTARRDERAASRWSPDGRLYRLRRMADSFDQIVIGGGPGGYVAAIRAAQLGQKTAVVERDKAGGRCLNYACIPAKTVLRTAEIFHEATGSAELGVVGNDVQLDWDALQKRRADVSAS